MSRLLFLFLFVLVCSCARGAVFEEHRAYAFANDTNYAYLLELGDDTLLARINLIREARQTIEIQTFIWAADETGTFLFWELYKAAGRGVRVRLLIDDLSLRGHARIVPILAVLHDNIEIRHYNPLHEDIDIGALKTIGRFTFQFGKANHRMHNKVVIVDGHYGITGGRNYQNDYYDRGTNRTFKDRDILVIGPVVTDMRVSFEEYWANERSVRSKDMRDVRAAIEAVQVERFDGDYTLPEIFHELDRCVEDDACMTQRIVSRGEVIDEMIFVADHPGKHEYGDDYAETTESMIKLMQEAEHRIVMQTPYLVAGDTKFFKGLMKQNEDLEFVVSTNSLAAADHFYAYAYSYKNKKKYLKKFKWQIHELKPEPPDYSMMVHDVEGVEHTDDHYTCIHAKTYLFDDDVV